MQAVNKLNNLVDRHAVAQYARDKLRVVPELLVEEARDTTDGVDIAVAVLILEVVALSAVSLSDLEDVTVSDGLGDVHSILLNLTSEDLIWAVILLTHEGDPILLAVLEAYDVGGDRLGAAQAVGT